MWKKIESGGLITATEKERLDEFWGKNHNILFVYNGTKYLAYKQLYDDGRHMQVLTDDGMYFGHMVIEQEAELLDTEYKGKKVRDMIREGEIEWIF